MNDHDGLIYACRLRSDGSAIPADWADLASGLARSGDALWVHLNLLGERTESWIREVSGLPEVAQDALLSEETRPRCNALGEGLLINLRGVNLNPGADPEDMVSIRLYVDKHNIVSVRRRRLIAVKSIRDAIGRNEGPATSAEFLVMLAQYLMDNLGPVIAELDDQVDALEERVIEASNAELRSELWQIRRQAIAIRRYVAPQRDAMAHLVAERVSWLDPLSTQQLREATDRITRYVEDLDTGRERAAIVQDELTTRLSEKMNRNTYVLSVAAGIFLPLTLLSGLLEINVGGIPGQSWPWAFTAVTLAMVVLGFLEFLILRRLRWL